MRAPWVGFDIDPRPTLGCRMLQDVKTGVNGDGLFFRNSKVAPRDITDGASQTIAVGEPSHKLGEATWVGAVTNGPRSLFTATSARQGNGTLPGLSARDYLHLGGGSAGGRD